MRPDGNLFANLPALSDNEVFTELLTQPGLRIERIVSTGQCSPDGFWYDQEMDEWVLLLQGAAQLRREIDTDAVSMLAGDHLYLPAGCRHRVDWTAPDQTTVWLAIHFASTACNKIQSA